ncbi:hypothetical protein [Phyllobacterium sp. SB3]|uniref:hypothetical protein n=1 Tax=Phyllobacterium sp. SB3 TaxID=3156073 RepID=UPI0032AEE141
MNYNPFETLPCISHEARSRWLLERVAEIRQNPNLDQAAIVFAEGSVKIFEGRYMANKVMANVAKRVIYMAILALHFNAAGDHHGAMISTLQHITTVLGLCSKNTTAATIDVLENLGLITRVADESDRRNHLIRPTDRMIMGTSKMVGVTFAAADKLYPDKHYVERINGAEDFMRRYFASSLHSLMNINTLFNRNSQLFSITDSGVMLLCKLMTIKNSGRGGDVHAVSFPFDEIGHLYGVSRTHIRRLMKRAEDDGLVRLLETGGRKVELLPRLDDVFAEMVASRVARAQFDIHLANGEYHMLPIDGGSHKSQTSQVETTF